MHLANRKLSQALRATAAVASLSVVFAGCGGEAVAEEKVPANVSLDELHDTAVKAGLDCASFTEWTDAEGMGNGVTEMGTCNPGAQNSSGFSVYADHEAADSAATAEIREELPPDWGTLPDTLEGPRLLGANWIINTEQAEELSADMDGEFLPPDDGWAEQDECEDQVTEIVGSMLTDQIGETSGAWEQALYTYGLQSPVVLIAQTMVQKSVYEMTTNGVESAIATTIGDASTKCAEHLAAP